MKKISVIAPKRKKKRKDAASRLQNMSEKSSILMENAEFLYTRLFKTSEGVTPEEAKWTPIKGANDILWQLNHVSRITNLSIPRLLTGDKTWEPDDWSADYKDAELSVDQLLEDLKKGSTKVSELLGSFDDAKLEEDTNYWGGTRKLKEGLFAYLAEITHHKGQIAYLRSNYARKQGKKWKYP